MGKHTKCPTCNGKGKVLDIYEIPILNKGKAVMKRPQSVEITCPTCNGNGWLEIKKEE